MVVSVLGSAQKLEQKKKSAKDERRFSIGSASTDGEVEEVVDPLLLMLKESKAFEKSAQEASLKRDDDKKKQEGREKERHDEMISAQRAQTDALGLLATTLQQNQEKTATALGSISESLSVQTNALAALLRNQQPNRDA